MERSFEQALNDLIAIAEKLESGNAGLENSLALYKEGLALSKHCAEILGRYEGEVALLQKESEGYFTTPFDTP